MRKITVYIFTVLVSLISCVREDLKNSIQNSIVQPEYSLPLGTFIFPMDTSFVKSDYIPNPFFNTYILYNNKSYQVNLYSSTYKEGDFNVNFSEKFKRNLVSLTFHLVASNYFPTDVEYQVYFLDQNSIKLDSLILNPPQILKAASVNTDGNVTLPNTQILEFTFTGSRLNELLYAQKFGMSTKTYFTNPKITQIKFSKTNRLEMITGVRIKLSVPFNEMY